MSKERKQVAKAEVQRLLNAGVIRPVKYPTWLSNVMLVKKKMASGECALISQA
jgi:hypothetical protein